MYKLSDKYQLDGTRVLELIDNNWCVIATFSYQKGATISPEQAALRFYNSL